MIPAPARHQDYGLALIALLALSCEKTVWQPVPQCIEWCPRKRTNTYCAGYKHQGWMVSSDYNKENSRGGRWNNVAERQGIQASRWITLIYGGQRNCLGVVADDEPFKFPFQPTDSWFNKGRIGDVAPQRFIVERINFIR